MARGVVGIQDVDLRILQQSLYQICSPKELAKQLFHKLNHGLFIKFSGFRKELKSVDCVGWMAETCHLNKWLTDVKTLEKFI